MSYNVSIIVSRKLEIATNFSLQWYKIHTKFHEISQFTEELKNVARTYTDAGV
jgi:hypothetical protein